MVLCDEPENPENAKRKNYLAALAFIYAVTCTSCTLLMPARGIIVLKIPSQRSAVYLAGSGRSWHLAQRVVKIVLPASISDFTLATGDSGFGGSVVRSAIVGMPFF